MARRPRAERVLRPAGSTSSPGGVLLPLSLLACLHPSPPAVAPGDTAWTPSPSGAHEAALLLGQLHWRAPGGPATLVEVPRWIPGDGALRTWLAWVDEGRLLVQQLDVDSVAAPDGPTDPACGVYDLARGAWSSPATCLTGSFWSVHAVELHEGVAFVASSGEGHPGLDVYRWTPEAGRGEDLFPTLDLYPFGPVEPLWEHGEVVLRTPCALERPRPCQTAEGDAVEGPEHRYVRRDGAWVRLR